MLLPLLTQFAVPQEQVVLHDPEFDRCKWEREVESALASVSTIYKHHVIQYFRNDPSGNCIVMVTFLDAGPIQYWLYQKGKQMTKIEPVLIESKNIAVIKFENNRYVFSGGKTVWSGF